MRVPRNVSKHLEIPWLRPYPTANGAKSYRVSAGANQFKLEQLLDQSPLGLAPIRVRSAAEITRGHVCVCSAANITRVTRMP